MSDAAMNGCWLAKPISLEFRLGIIPLKSVMFSSKECNVHFSKLAADLDRSNLPVGDFAPDCEALALPVQPIEKKLPRLAFLPRAMRYVPHQYQRYAIDVRGSFQDYLKKFSAKSRQTLGRKVRRFAKYSGGQARWREFRGCEEIPDFYRLARQVSKVSWQEEFPEGGLPDTGDFHREISELAARDAVSGYILFHGEKPIAYAFCLAQEGILVVTHLGYDPQYRRWSPGTVLLYLLLEMLFVKGEVHLFDFGGQGNWYKKFFATRATLCADIYYFPRSLRIFLLLGLHSILCVLNRTAGNLLDWFGLKTSCQRWLASIHSRQKDPVHTQQPVEEL